VKEVTLAGRGQRVLVVAVFAFHPGKTIIQIAAIEIAIDHLLNIVTPES